jgi:hypothetical protein
MKHLTNLLTDRERELTAFRYTNPQLTVRQISGILLLQPGELNRLLTAQRGTRADACPSYWIHDSRLDEIPRSRAPLLG